MRKAETEEAIREREMQKQQSEAEYQEGLRQMQEELELAKEKAEARRKADMEEAAQKRAEVLHTRGGDFAQEQFRRDNFATLEIPEAPSKHVSRVQNCNTLPQHGPRIVFQEEPAAPTNAPEPTVSCAAS